MIYHRPHNLATRHTPSRPNACFRISRFSPLIGRRCPSNLQNAATTSSCSPALCMNTPSPPLSPIAAETYPVRVVGTRLLINRRARRVWKVTQGPGRAPAIVFAGLDHALAALRATVGECSCLLPPLDRLNGLEGVGGLLQGVVDGLTFIVWFVAIGRHERKVVFNCHCLFDLIWMRVLRAREPRLPGTCLVSGCGLIIYFCYGVLCSSFAALSLQSLFCLSLVHKLDVWTCMHSSHA